MMATQHDFIGRVTAALGNAEMPEQRRRRVFTDRPSRGPGEIVKRARARTEADRLKLLQQLIAQGKPLNLNVIPKKDPSDTAVAIAGWSRKSPPSGRDRSRWPPGGIR